MQLQLERFSRCTSTDLASAPAVVVRADIRDAALLVAGAACQPGNINAACGVVAIVKAIGERGLRRVAIG